MKLNAEHLKQLRPNSALATRRVLLIGVNLDYLTGTFRYTNEIESTVNGDLTYEFASNADLTGRAPLSELKNRACMKVPAR